MLSLEEVEPGSLVTHRNTGLRYTMVPLKLFREEFVSSDRYNMGRSRSKKGGRGRRTSAQSAAPTGPKVKGKIKKLVRERGFGFVRGDDGREVFFHRSGLGPSDYDSLGEGDVVEYVVQEGPRGARAENVRAISESE
jgi:CspA family cold shock protein